MTMKNIRCLDFRTDNLERIFDTGTPGRVIHCYHTDFDSEIYVNRAAKNYVLLTPDNRLITVFNLNKFCKEHGLNQGNMSMVVNGKATTHKGYRRG
jgi:hypothetical protein